MAIILGRLEGDTAQAVHNVHSQTPSASRGSSHPGDRPAAARLCRDRAGGLLPREHGLFLFSLEEAGQIGLLAAVVVPDRHVLIPNLDLDRDLRSLESIATSLARCVKARSGHLRD
jgi:hypothetical protein